MRCVYLSFCASQLLLTVAPGTTFQAKEALAALAGEAARYDANGIDVVFLNSKKTGKDMKVRVLHVLSLYCRLLSSRTKKKYERYSLA